LLRLVDYMYRRLKEDQINEWDYKLRSENTRICINYVFEYFNNYLTEEVIDEKTVLEIEKLEKYRSQIGNFDQQAQEWLLSTFEDYGKKMNIIVRNFVKKQDLFLLYNADNEFRSLSYECYSQLNKKYPFIRDNTEMIYEIIKQVHRIETWTSWDGTVFFINDTINEWIKDTYKKHNVNLVAFADKWLNKFYDNDGLWPAGSKKKIDSHWRGYEYDYKQTRNLFNLNDLYRRLPKKPFIRGRKQDLEILMMFIWLNSIVGDEDYWDEYINRVGIKDELIME
jgi:hypothetical protein